MKKIDISLSASTDKEDISEISGDFDRYWKPWLYYGLGKVHCSTVHENSEDFHSLLDFKNGITNDPNEALSNWTSNIHFCRWNGVNCTLTPAISHHAAQPSQPELSWPNLILPWKSDLP